MKNMGLGELVLVAPRTPVGKVGERMAAHAADVLARRRDVADLGTAIGDCRLVVGTVGRATTGPDTPIAPHVAAPRIVAAARTGRVAIVFGPEDHGLSNAQLGLCQLQVRIPTAAEYGSLNLAQAVAVLAYEIHLAAADGAREPRSGGATVRSRAVQGVSGRGARRARAAGDRAAGSPAASSAAATSREREDLLAHLAGALDRIGFLSRQNPAHILRDVRSLFARSGLTTRDVQVWRGIARQVLWAAERTGRTR
jgi:tRNA C32,U32 (ribose-2'-O)-methylase TrmJ